MNSITFTLPGEQTGLKETKGVVHFLENILLLEFETRDTIFDVIGSGIKELKLSINDLSKIELEKGWFSTTILIHARSLKVIGDLPNHCRKGATFNLSIKKKDRDIAENAIADINLRIAEARLKEQE